MTTEIVTKTYERLDFYIDQIASDIDNAYGKFVECCRIAVEEEHLTPKEAWEYVYTKLKDHVAKSTLYLWGDKVLPEGSKKATKPKKIPSLESPKAETTQFDTKGMGVVITEEEESSSASESATGPDGNEVEQEVETPKATSVALETITIPTIEYEELKEAVRQSSQPVRASELEPRHTSLMSGTTIIPHNRIIEIFLACKQTQGNDKDLEFMWEEGKFVTVNPK